MGRINPNSRLQCIHAECGVLSSLSVSGLCVEVRATRPTYVPSPRAETVEDDLPIKNLVFTVYKRIPVPEAEIGKY